VVEPGINEQQIALYRAVHDAGEMTVRTDVLYRALPQKRVEKGIAALKAQKNDDMLRFTGIKFLLDGGVEGGRMNWPYRIVPGEQTDALSRCAAAAARRRGRVCRGAEADRRRRPAGADHAVGDETIDVTVRSYGRVNKEKPIRDLHWTIMHLFHPSTARSRRCRDRHHGDDAGSPCCSGTISSLVGRRARRVRDPDSRGDRCRRAGRRRHGRAGVRSIRSSRCGGWQRGRC